MKNLLHSMQNLLYLPKPEIGDWKFGISAINPLPSRPHTHSYGDILVLHTRYDFATRYPVILGIVSLKSLKFENPVIFAQMLCIVKLIDFFFLSFFCQCLLLAVQSYLL